MSNQGNGSILILFDMYLDAMSNRAVAFSPRRFDRTISKSIMQAGMVRRRGMLDVWESMRECPCTSFHSLQESHVRCETWPNEGHLNGEVQLCHYSRDNSEAAREMVQYIVRVLKPAIWTLLIVRRGPGMAGRTPYPVESVRMKRGWRRPEIHRW